MGRLMAIVRGHSPGSWWTRTCSQRVVRLAAARLITITPSKSGNHKQANQNPSPLFWYARSISTPLATVTTIPTVSGIHHQRRHFLISDSNSIEGVVAFGSAEGSSTVTSGVAGCAAYAPTAGFISGVPGSSGSPRSEFNNLTPSAAEITPFSIISSICKRSGSLDMLAFTFHIKIYLITIIL